jgi:hypothetical protein
MQFDTSALDNVDIPNSTRVTEFVKEKSTSIRKITFRDFLHALKTNRITGYEHNRGTCVVADGTVKSVRYNLHCPSFGQMTGAWFNDVFCLADTHGRAMGLIYRLIDKQLTLEELNSEISVQEVSSDDFLQVYQLLNSGKNHSAKDNLNNPDYFFGRWIDDLIARVERVTGSDARTYLTATAKRTNLSYLLYCVGNHCEMDRYSDIFLKRQAVGKLYRALENADSPFTITNESLRKLTEAMVFYVNFCTAIEEKAAKVGIRVSKVIRSGPFFSMIVMDRLRDQAMHAHNAEKLAATALRNIGAVDTIVPQITGSSVIEINRAERDLWKAIKKAPTKSMAALEA